MNKGSPYLTTILLMYLKLNHGKVELEKGVRVIDAYYENGSSNKSTFCAFYDIFDPHNRPTKSDIAKILEKCQETRSFVDVQNPVGARVGRSIQNIAFARENVDDSPNTSILH